MYSSSKLYLFYAFNIVNYLFYVFNIVNRINRYMESTSIFVHQIFTRKKYLVIWSQKKLKTFFKRVFSLQSDQSRRCLRSKPSLKVGSVNKAFLFWYWQRLKIYFFRNKTFSFFSIESWNLQHLFEKDFRETSQYFNLIRESIEKNENSNCLNEMTFCEISRNSISNRCWKFKISILKNKKVLSLKKYFLS